MKKFFWTLLCCILLALSFAPAKDASAATELSKMRVDNWAFPKSGQPVSTSCTITIDGQSASDVTTYCEMLWYNSSGQIVEGIFYGGSNYTLRVVFRLKSSYTLSDSFYAIFDGGSTSSAKWVGSGADYWEVEATYRCSDIIKGITITSVTEPEEGATPVTTFSAESNCVSARCSHSSWYNLTDEVWMNGEAFEAGKKYRFCASVENNFGYSWPASYSTIPASMNGHTASVTPQIGTSYYYVTCEFTCPKKYTEITEIRIIGVTEPVDGALPSSSLSIASVGTTIAYPAEWNNLTDDCYGFTTPFEGGKVYGIKVYFIESDGYKLPSDPDKVSVTINGQSASIGYVPANNCYCAYILYTCPEKPAEYSITVVNGTADKITATAGTRITIAADSDTATNKFSNWVVLSGGTNSMLASSSSKSTSFIMPAEDVIIAADFIEESTGTGSTGTGSTGTGSTDTGSTGTGSTGTGSTGTSSTGTGSTGTGSTDTGSTGTGSTGTGSTDTGSTGTGSTGTGASSETPDSSTGTSTESEPLDESTTDIPQKGDVIVSNTEKAIYKVTAVGNRSGKVGKVTYLEPTKRATSITIKSTVTIDGIKYKVTAIASEAFKGDKKLEKLIVGKEIKIIGKSAFYGCTSLKSVELKGAYKIKAKAFCKCSKLTKVVISSSRLTSKTVGSDVFTKINAKAVITVPSKKVSSYKKLFKKVGLTGSSQTVKGK